MSIRFFTSIQMQPYWDMPIGPLSDRCSNARILLLGRFIRRDASEQNAELWT